MELHSNNGPRVLITVTNGVVATVVADGECVPVVEYTDTSKTDVPVVVVVSRRDLDADLAELKCSVPMRPST